jgi:hypothetical protein
VPDPAPLELEALLDPKWLGPALDMTEELGTSEVVEVLQTVATKVRFRTPTASGGMLELCVKGYFGAPPERQGGGTTEGRFYEELSSRLPGRRPTARYAATNPDTGHTIVIMNDLVAAGCQFRSPLEYYSPDQVAASLGELATLHGATWQDEQLRAESWLAPRLGAIAQGFPVAVLQGLLDDGRAEGLPSAVRDAEHVTEATRSLAAADTNQAVCLVHGDAHVGNVFQDSSGAPGFVDWQIAHFGHWATDVAYHIASSLHIEDRRRHEHDLIRHYLEQLDRSGVDTPAFADAWEAYRSHLIGGYYLWAIARSAERAWIERFVERLAVAVSDHDASFSPS